MYGLLMVGQSPMHRLFCRLEIVLFIFLLVGCASHKTIYSINTATGPNIADSYNVQYKKPTIIKPGKINWGKNDKLALLPSGPYSYQQFSLDNPVVDMVCYDQHAYVITQTNKGKTHLLIILFPNQGQATLVSKISVGKQISKLSYAKGKILLVDITGGIEIFDVTDPQRPERLLEYKSGHPVQDMQFDGVSAYLLQTNNTITKIKFSLKSPGKVEARLLHQWQLPLHATSITARSNYIWATEPQGIAVIKLGDQNATLIDQRKTSGYPVDIQIHEKLALVTDAKDGLVLFDISNNEKLQWIGSYNKSGAIKRISLKASLFPSTSSPLEKILATLSNGTIMSIALNNPELPASGPVYKADKPIIATAYLGDDTLIATQNIIQRIIMSDAGNYAISPEGINQGGSRRGVIRGNILYVADWFSGLHLYDISNPQQLRHLSNYHTPGSSKGVVLFGNYALVGDDDQGLQIINIENPNHPVWVSEVTPDAMTRQGLAYTMKRVGKTLYLADHRGGFHIIDLTDIHHPKRLGGYDTPGKSWGIDVSGQYVFVADDQSGLLVFDATDATNPNLLAQFNPGGQAEDVVIRDNRAYLVFFDKGLYVLDISNPLKLKVLSHLPIPGNARGIEVTDDLVYVTGWESGLHIVDINKPGSPRIISSFDTDGSAWGVNVKDGYAYLLDWWGGIKVIDVHQPSAPAAVGQYHARGQLQRLRTNGRYLYAASGSGGLQVFDIKNPLNPIWITGIDMNGHAQDIWHDETRAYVAAGDGGVLIMDTLDPFYTRRIGQIDTPGLAQKVRARDDTLFIQDNRAGILVIDTGNPQHPKEISRLPFTTRDLWVDDDAFWAATKTGLAWWRHDSGFLAGKHQQYAIPGGANWVRTRDRTVITAQRNGLVQIWQQSPQGLSEVSEYEAGEPILDVQLDGQFLYLLGTESGLMVVNIQTPATPQLTTVYPSTGLYTGVEIANEAAFFAGENKLASVTLLPNPVPITSPSGDPILQLPANLPIGSYHLLKMMNNGQKQLFPNAVNIHRSSHSRSRPILEKYRQMLKGSR